MIDKLKERLLDLRGQMRALGKEISEIEQQIASLECPIAVGDVVEFGWNDKNLRRAKVISIKSKYGSWELGARNIKKDGSLGDVIKISRYQNPVKVTV